MNKENLQYYSEDCAIRRMRPSLPGQMSVAEACLRILVDHTPYEGWRRASSDDHGGTEPSDQGFVANTRRLIAFVDRHPNPPAAVTALQLAQRLLHGESQQMSLAGAVDVLLETAFDFICLISPPAEVEK